MFGGNNYFAGDDTYKNRNLGDSSKISFSKTNKPREVIQGLFETGKIIL